MRGPRNYLLCLHAPVWWIAVLCAVTIPVHAATVTVMNTNDGGPGSLRGVLAIANDGDTIVFAVAGSIALTSGELLVNKSITISGPTAADVVVNGNAKSRVFHIAPGQSVSITDLTITNGVARGNPPNDFGGGIYNDHAVLALSNCTISNNRAGFGSGIYNDGFEGTATLAISNSAIYHNTATYRGGGIYNDADSSGYASLTISSSTVTGNSARAGGGIYNDGLSWGNAMLAVNSTKFSGNSADFGGCIFNESSLSNASLTVDTSTFSGNRAREAGGCIYNDMLDGYGTQTLNNSSLRGNSAGNSGGSIYSDHAISFTLNYCAISGNAAQNWGGGIYNDGSQSGAAWMRINSSTLNGNSAGTGGGIFNDGAQGGDTHLQISNSTISENMATYGGGLANNGYDGFYVSVQISSTTFCSNSATQFGGNIYNVGQTGQDTVIVTLTNTILKSGRLGGNIFDDSHTVLSLGHNLSNDACGGVLMGQGDQTDTEPMLGRLQNNGGPILTHALLPGSAAINAGDPNFIPPPSSDQRGPGFDRVASGRIDIGSFEVQAPAPTGGNPTLRPRPILPAR